MGGRRVFVLGGGKGGRAFSLRASRPHDHLRVDGRRLCLRDYDATIRCSVEIPGVAGAGSSGMVGGRGKGQHSKKEEAREGHSLSPIFARLSPAARWRPIPRCVTAVNQIFGGTDIISCKKWGEYMKKQAFYTQKDDMAKQGGSGLPQSGLCRLVADRKKLRKTKRTWLNSWGGFWGRINDAVAQRMHLPKEVGWKKQEEQFPIRIRWNSTNATQK